MPAWKDAVEESVVAWLPEDGSGRVRLALAFAVVLAAHLVVLGGFGLWQRRVPGERLQAEPAGPSPSRNEDFQIVPPADEQSIAEDEAAARVSGSSADGEASLYQVRSGDSYWRIAAKHGISVGRLLEYNGHSESRTLRAGETLRIPSSE